MGKKSFVQFGAGNIGRSFMGRVFGTGGYSVTFIDINRQVIDKLNQDGSYRVVVKKNNVPDRIITVEDAGGILSTDTEAVVSAICSANVMATSVGKNVLPIIAPAVAKGLEKRHSMNPDNPLNIILAENVHNGAAFFAAELRRHLPGNFPLDDFVGLLETSIGKMVPIMPLEVVKKDPTIVFSEEFNTLIFDRKGYKGALPDIPDIMPVKNIAAYVDRKLCIHNLGHAAVSYFGFAAHPEAVYLYQVLEDREIFSKVRSTMLQSAEGLMAEYPGVFTREDIVAHIDDLIERFRNVALGDTIFRVGRDLPRKLYRDDRVLGAARLCVKHHLPCGSILEVFRAGLQFMATDESGERFAEDIRMIDELGTRGLEWVLANTCKLDWKDPIDSTLASALLELH